LKYVGESTLNVKRRSNVGNQSGMRSREKCIAEPSFDIEDLVEGSDEQLMVVGKPALNGLLAGRIEVTHRSFSSCAAR
jgi:hypothetical protein